MADRLPKKRGRPPNSFNHKEGHPNFANSITPEHGLVVKRVGAGGVVSPPFPSIALPPHGPASGPALAGPGLLPAPALVGPPLVWVAPTYPDDECPSDGGGAAEGSGGGEDVVMGSPPEQQQPGAAAGAPPAHVQTYIAGLQLCLLGRNGSPPVAVACSNDTCTFCFPGSNEDGTLDFSSFSFPSLKRMQFSDGGAVAGWCTCTPEQQMAGAVLAECSAAAALGWTQAQGLGLCSDCLHVQTLKVCAVPTRDGTSASHVHALTMPELATPPTCAQQAWVALTTTTTLDDFCHRAGPNPTGAVQPFRLARAPSAASAWHIVTLAAGHSVVVEQRGKVWRCKACHANKTCKHVQAVLGYLQSEGALDDDDLASGAEEAGRDEQTEHMEQLMLSYLGADGSLLVKSVSQV